MPYQYTVRKSVLKPGRLNKSIVKVTRKKLKQQKLKAKTERASIPAQLVKNKTSSAGAATADVSGTYTSSDGLFVIVFE